MKTLLSYLFIIFIGCLFLFSCKDEVGRDPDICYVCEYNTEVVQTIKRTCNKPDCYYALYTWVYYKGDLIKRWIDDAEGITPEQVKGRKINGDSLISNFKRLEFRYKNILKESK